ncbi:MAG: SDR family oxidoreductase [Opitutales bacterium]
MILITGASGNVGRPLADHLVAAGEPVRVGVRRPEAGRAPEGAEAARLDLENPSTFAEAFVGCDRVFLMRPPAVAKTKSTLNPFVAAARKAGVRHLVFLSVLGADAKAWVPHRAVEQALEAGPKDWTILRPGFFAQNFEQGLPRRHRRPLPDLRARR